MAGTGDNITWLIAFSAYLSYMWIIGFGYIRDFWRKYFPEEEERRKPEPGYAPLVADFDDFYRRRVYLRCQDCWNRPICSAPSAYIDVWKRYSNNGLKTLQLTEPRETIRALNLGSYNYLGFSQPPEHVTSAVLKDLDTYGVACGSPYLEFGFTQVHKELERTVARYLGMEDAFIVGMGFATNSTVIPTFAGKGSLIISDSLNHTSIVCGSRASGAKIKVFKHGDYKALERIVRESIVEGQPRTRRPWKKIIILVEGIYSMEGEIVNLPEVVRIKKKYNCYLYVDEAHSIGALGDHGRGVCEKTGVNPRDVDILMGTFTKSFGAVGGYIAGNKDLIAYLRNSSFGTMYGASMPVPCAQQIISVIRVLLGEDGTTIGQEKIKQLHDNANFFREGLRKLGFEVIGDEDSPVIIVMLYTPGRIPGFSRECLKKNIAVVVVGAPATPLLEGRVRFCVSASHTKEDLEHALHELDEIGDLTLCKFKSSRVDSLKQMLF